MIYSAHFSIIANCHQLIGFKFNIIDNRSNERPFAKLFIRDKMDQIGLNVLKKGWKSNCIQCCK